MTDVASTTIQLTSYGAEVIAPGATMTGSCKVASLVSTIKQIDATPRQARWTREKVSANRGNLEDGDDRWVFRYRRTSPAITSAA